MGEFSVVTAAVCAETGALGIVTNLTSLGGVFNWGVPGIGSPGVPIATALTLCPVVVTEVCPVTPPCTSLGAAFVHLYPVLYNLPLNWAKANYLYISPIILLVTSDSVMRVLCICPTFQSGPSG